MDIAVLRLFFHYNLNEENWRPIIANIICHCCCCSLHSDLKIKQKDSFMELSKHHKSNFILVCCSGFYTLHRLRTTLSPKNEVHLLHMNKQLK